MDRCQTTLKCTVNKANIHNRAQSQLLFILGEKWGLYVDSLERRPTNHVAVVAWAKRLIFIFFIFLLPYYFFKPQAFMT